VFISEQCPSSVMRVYSVTSVLKLFRRIILRNFKQ